MLILRYPATSQEVKSPMLDQSLNLARSARRALINAVYPSGARRYRTGSGNAPVTLLKFLGIADASYRDGFYTLSRAVEEMPKDGAVLAECGVYRGSTLLGMANRLRDLGAKDFHLIGFDSFEGFPQPSPDDALSDGTYHPQATKGFFSDARYDDLQHRVELLGFQNEITLVKGYFENTLGQFADRRFSLVHLDCDLYDSYMTCLNFFYPRMRRGGYMVFDEYDFCASIYPGAQKAIDSFLSDKPEKIQRFPEAVSPRYFIVKE
jgi:hypothetical protein